MVLLYHLTEMLRLPAPESLGFISTHFGLGVPLFYTLSGFVLAYGYADKLDNTSAIRRFYIRRLFRIAPLFYTMLALWLLANWVVLDRTFPFQILFLNVSFLFGLVPGQHESIVRAGWSIGIEMLFYFIFPLFSILLPSLRASVVAFAGACLLSNAAFNAFSSAGLASYAYMNLGTHLPFFMAGMLSFRFWQATRFHLRPGWGWAFLAGSVLMALNADRLNAVLAVAGLERGLWAFVFAALLLSACFARNPLLTRGPLKHLGKLSFSLYLLHPMIMVILMKLDFPAFITALSPDTMVNFAVASVAVIGLVWIASELSFRLIEQPGIEFGRRLAMRHA